MAKADLQPDIVSFLAYFLFLFKVIKDLKAATHLSPPLWRLAEFDTRQSIAAVLGRADIEMILTRAASRQSRQRHAGRKLLGHPYASSHDIIIPPWR